MLRLPKTIIFLLILTGIFFLTGYVYLNLQKSRIKEPAITNEGALFTVEGKDGTVNQLISGTIEQIDGRKITILWDNKNLTVLLDEEAKIHFLKEEDDGKWINTPNLSSFNDKDLSGFLKIGDKVTFDKIIKSSTNEYRSKLLTVFR